MAKVDLPTDAAAPIAGVESVAAPGRFARVGRTLVDLSAVVAIEFGDDGRGVLHLSGGQAVELPSEGAGGVLKRLGLPAPKRKPRAKRAEQTARTQKPVSLRTAIAGFFA